MRETRGELASRSTCRCHVPLRSFAVASALPPMSRRFNTQRPPFSIRRPGPEVDAGSSRNPCSALHIFCCELMLQKGSAKGQHRNLARHVFLAFFFVVGQETVRTGPLHVPPDGRTRGGRRLPARCLERGDRRGVSYRGCVVETPGAGQGVLHGVRPDGPKVKITAPKITFVRGGFVLLVRRVHAS